MLVWTNFACKLFLFYSLVSSWIYCLKNNLGTYILEGHGISIGRKFDIELPSKKQWIHSIWLLVLLATSSLWSGIKLAFETVFFTFWLLSLCANGFASVFERQE